MAGTSDAPPGDRWTTDGRSAISAAIITSAGKVLLVRRQVEEGELSWQFPAGAVEPGESAEEAAVREAHEETAVTVRAMSRLGSRVHPHTGRTMYYIACELFSGTAEVADAEELAEVAWCDRATFTTNIPYPLFGPLQKHLDARLR